jgi:hypothetical protein
MIGHEIDLGYLRLRSFAAQDQTDLPGGQFFDSPVQPHRKKYFCFLPTQITGLFLAIPALSEGRIAIVTNVGRGCGGRECAFDEQRRSRTAKTCGPDASTLALSW